MGTVSGSYIEHTVNNATRKWRAQMTYGTATSSVTTYTIPVSALKMDLSGGSSTTMKCSAGHTHYYLYRINDSNGGGTTTITSKTSSYPSSDKTVNGEDDWTMLSSSSVTFTRKATAYTGTIRWRVQQTSASSWSGTSDADYSVTIPALPSYTVTANANGGSITGGTGWSGTGNSATKSVQYNATISTLPSASRVGYTLKGFYTAATGGTQVTTSTKITTTTSIYAQWTPITYTVSYNSNGGTSGSTSASNHTYDVDQTLTPNGFTRTDYTFQGWATEATGSVVYTNQQSVRNLRTTSGTYNLYAVWKDRYQTASILINQTEAYRVSSNGSRIEDPANGTYVYVKVYVNPATYDATNINTGIIGDYYIDGIRVNALSVSTKVASSSTPIEFWISNVAVSSVCSINMQAVGYDSGQIDRTASEITTLTIPKAEFIMDISGTYNSVAFFSVAEDAAAYDNILQIGGDICLHIDNSSTQTIDSSIAAALQALSWTNDVQIGN